MVDEREKAARIEEQLAHGSDAELCEAVIAAIAAPRATARSSFLLHAPLELLARLALLPLVEPAGRAAGRERVADIGRRYLAAGEPLAPAPGRGDAGDRLAILSSCLDHHVSPSLVDDAASNLGPDEARAALLALAPRVIGHLGAAAHAPILFVELPRVLGRLRGAAGLLRAPLVALTEQAGARVRWVQEPARAVAPPLSEAALAALLAAPPRVQSPSGFVLPTVRSVESLCAEHLGGLREDDLLRARRALLRDAAWSMVEDDPAHAPYGWSHTLTLPAAVLALAASGAVPARPAVEVAATLVLAFRATLSSVPLQRRVPADRPAARRAWDRAVAGEAPALRRELATRAASRHDAHLAKYALACFDAAAEDPDAEPLYLAAAATLDDLWAHRPDVPE